MQSIKLFRYHLKSTNTFLLNQRLLKNVARVKQEYDLNFAVAEAKKVVEYSTSLNLRWIHTDEFASMAILFSKLVTTNHPLMTTIRKLFIGNNMPPWGLIVLLVSKAFGLNSEFSCKENDLVAGVLHSQRTLIEITEMLRISNLIHKSILNKDEYMQKDDEADLNLGNKITLLSGDYLLAKSYSELAALRNQNLNEIMCSALRDMVDAEFMGLRDKHDQPYPSMPLQNKNEIKIKNNFESDPYEVQEVLGYPLAEWTLRTILASGTLLGRSCQGALYLAKHSKEVQNLSYLFGKNMALAGQAKLDREAFVPGVNEPFSLVSAPVMLHLQHDPFLYEKIVVHKDDISKVDYEELKKIIVNGPALKETKNLENYYFLKAMDLLNEVPPSDARTGLENIISAML